MVERKNPGDMLKGYQKTSKDTQMGPSESKKTQVFCPVCDRSFQDRRGLSSHVRQSHEDTEWEQVKNQVEEVPLQGGGPKKTSQGIDSKQQANQLVSQFIQKQSPKVKELMDRYLAYDSKYTKKELIGELIKKENELNKQKAGGFDLTSGSMSLERMMEMTMKRELMKSWNRPNRPENSWSRPRNSVNELIPLILLSQRSESKEGSDDLKKILLAQLSKENDSKLLNTLVTEAVKSRNRLQELVLKGNKKDYVEEISRLKKLISLIKEEFGETEESKPKVAKDLVKEFTPVLKEGIKAFKKRQPKRLSPRQKAKVAKITEPKGGKKIGKMSKSREAKPKKKKKGKKIRNIQTW